MTTQALNPFANGLGVSQGRADALPRGDGK